LRRSPPDARIANRGHPPPLLIHEDKVRRLDPGRPGLPLGLGDLDAAARRDGGGRHVDIYELAVGDTLLLYTDGVTEARDASGALYPLERRLERWTGHRPDALLATVRSDLMRHSGARLSDDVAMVAVHRLA
jgi:serine phosphatase RsbU (regulator of sigma subunit)